MPETVVIQFPRASHVRYPLAEIFASFVHTSVGIVGLDVELAINGVKQVDIHKKVQMQNIVGSIRRWWIVYEVTLPDDEAHDCTLTVTGWFRGEKQKGKTPGPSRVKTIGFQIKQRTEKGDPEIIYPEENHDLSGELDYFPSYGTHREYPAVDATILPPGNAPIPAQNVFDIASDMWAAEFDLSSLALSLNNIGLIVQNGFGGNDTRSQLHT